MFFEQVAEIETGGREVVALHQRFAIAGLGLVEPADRFERERQVVMPFDILRIDGDRLAQQFDGLAKLALQFECVAEIAVGLRQLGIELDGGAKAFDRLVATPQLLEHVAQIVVRHAIVGPGVSTWRKHSAASSGRPAVESNMPSKFSTTGCRGSTTSTCR